MVVLRVLLTLTAAVSLSSAVSHSVQYFYTGVTPGINFPEFTLVGQMDGEQFVYYDSNIRETIPKTEWIKKVVDDEPNYWQTETRISQDWEGSFKVNVQTLMQRFNHTEGVHTAQMMYGCELNGEETIRGYEQFGYDGKDFLSLDLINEIWTAADAKAFPSKQKWDKTTWAAQDKSFLLNECITWLQKYVEYGRSTLERKVLPEVSVFQKDSSSPVVCHATGFFPKAVMISWQKDGEELNEDVELRETLPNQDGTFQKRSILTLSPEELKTNKYTCVVQHSSLEKELVLQVSDLRILQGAGGRSVGVIVGTVVTGLIVLIACVGIVIFKKRVRDFKNVPGSETDSLSSTSTSCSVQSNAPSAAGLLSKKSSATAPH